jgi:hypothetical protein
MAGLTETQWDQVRKRLDKIDEIHTESAEIKIELIGMTGNNGIKAQVKKNTEAIEKLKHKTSTTIKTWVPTLISIIMIIAFIWTMIDSSVQKSIQFQQLQQLVSVTPAPTP